MTSWFDGIAGAEFATAVIWTLAALVLLVIVLVIVRLVRSMTFGTFVAGGRNRKTRLAVMDATAVDSHRRLVLVRRDDIEHLILIGGPTDVVVEREIRMGAGRRQQSAFGPESEYEAQPVPAPVEQPVPAPMPRQRAPEPVQRPPLPIRAAPPAPARAPQPPRNQEPQPERERAPPPAPRSTRPPAPRSSMREGAPPARSGGSRLPPAGIPAALPASSSFSSSYAPAPAAGGVGAGYAPLPASTLDDALMRELEVTFDASPAQTIAAAPEMTLDDEMTKLLGELSSSKR